MMNELFKPKVKAYALVRDSNGIPKIDGNPRDLPDEIKDMLTDEEFIEALRKFEETLNGNT